MKTINLPEPLYQEWLKTQKDKHLPRPKVICTMSIENRDNKGKIISDYYQFEWQKIKYGVYYSKYETILNKYERIDSGKGIPVESIQGTYQAPKN